MKRDRDLSCHRGLTGFSFFSAVPAAGYFAVQKLRERFYSYGLLKQSKARIPVISVGNILLGGTGKTPFTIYLAGLLRNQGYRPVVISRGYKGSNQSNYLVVNDGKGGSPAAPSVAGDEPFLMAIRNPEIPVIIGPKRIDPVSAAVELFDCNVAVLDDGFQHLPLARDLDIVLINGTEDRMFPLGGLREPLSALRRADVIILAGMDSVPEIAVNYVQSAQVFTCRFEAETLQNHRGSHETSLFAGREVVLCSAIAGPQRFRKTAEMLGWIVVDHSVFRDHHAMTDHELHTVLKNAGDRPVIVTEKDWVKMPSWFRSRDDAFALRIRAVMDNEESFLILLNRAIKGHNLRIPQ